MTAPTTVKDILPHLTELAVQALSTLGCEGAVQLATPPSPDMGDFGFPCFPWSRTLRKPPVQIAQDVVAALAPLVEGDPLVDSVSAAGPFVNFRLNPGGTLAVITKELRAGAGFGANLVATAQRVMVEYSSPNTNKPQHLGHIRNNLLGELVGNLLAHYGHAVLRVNLINDRGIHICKSMLAYKLHGEGATPESVGIKGDHLVGDYYVMFNRLFESEYAGWLKTPAADAAFEAWAASGAGKRAAGDWTKARTTKGEPAPTPDADQLRDLFRGGFKDTFFNTDSTLGAQARDMLVKWEAGDAEVRGLWRTMNDWVEAGFKETYARLGVHFDQIDFESNTYLLGKDIVEDGLARGVFEKAANGATVLDLSKIGMSGQKAVLRPDGTSLYTTQDLGTATSRFDRNQLDRLIYVVGDEQNHHFQVLFAMLGLLRPELAGHCHHLSYGMVLLPDGRMKSREGNVVDADDLIDEVERLALAAVNERYPELDAEEAALRANAIGLAAIKFYLMNVSAPTTMTFDPEESVRFEGQTGPYCLYAYARGSSILRKAGLNPITDPQASDAALLTLTSELERNVIVQVTSFPAMLEWASERLDPSKMAEFAYKTAQTFARFYNDDAHNVLKSEGDLKAARLQLVWAVREVLRTALGLLGITTLEEM